MPEYEYQVVDRGGRAVTGQAEAGSVTELVRRLGGFMAIRSSPTPMPGSPRDRRVRCGPQRRRYGDRC